MSDAVDAGVDGGEGLQRLDARLDEEAHEAQADAVLLLERFLVLRPQRHDGRQVGFVERRQDGGVLLGGQQPLGDALADRRHPLARLAAAVGWRLRVRATRCRESPADRGALAARAGGGRCAGARYACTSSLMTRPPRPVPASLRGSTPSSAASCRAAGDSSGSTAAAAVVTGIALSSTTAGAAACLRLGRGADPFLDAADHRADGDLLALLRRDASGRPWPGRTPPSWPCPSPARTAVRLSRTASPSAFSQRARTPSVIASPTDGTLMSTAIVHKDEGGKDEG